ncbi:RNA polymerase sigma factor [Mycobacterium sp.]|uniref:RNA polymerase sigma factor n=1 Tax=Mycobacterium sp. TaxID=1785 RepID=UPI003F949DD4
MIGINDESGLIRRARAGDQEAFGELITANRARVWAVCLRITGNTHDAQDALQDTLVAAWRHIERFRSDSRFSTWLFRIASNAALAVARRRPPTDVAEIGDVAGGRDPADCIAEAERVQSALMALPEVFRAALVLRIYGDLSYGEIAVHQGIPVQTVKSRLSRARSMLEQRLTPTSDIPD